MFVRFSDAHGACAIQLCVGGTSNVSESDSDALLGRRRMVARDTSVDGASPVLVSVSATDDGGVPNRVMLGLGVVGVVGMDGGGPGKRMMTFTDELDKSSAALGATLTLVGVVMEKSLTMDGVAFVEMLMLAVAVLGNTLMASSSSGSYVFPACEGGIES